MSVENDPGFWKWMVGGIVTTIGGAWSGFKYLDARLAKKADKHVVANQLQEVKGELAVQRGHIGKIFQQMTESERIAEARHRELLMHLVQKKGE